ncbi:hypothetical protein [Streptomyces sp. NPDC002685]|uniref:hypothetical protein n=1 Tax=Streptomyces sp. NPDC002685 TaxID=3154540 RepID=UPI00332C9F1C
MTREQRLTMADTAVERAAVLAQEAEYAAKGDSRHKAEPFAAASTAWARVARAHAAIAAATTDTADTDPED